MRKVNFLKLESGVDYLPISSNSVLYEGWIYTLETSGWGSQYKKSQFNPKPSRMTNEQIKKLLWLVPQLDVLETEQLEMMTAKNAKRVEEKLQGPAWDTAYYIELQRAACKILSARYIEDAKAMNYRQFVK